MKNNKLGGFLISEDLLANNIDAVANFFADIKFVPLKVETAPGSIIGYREFTGYSPEFMELNDGVTVLFYEIEHIQDAKYHTIGLKLRKSA